MRTRKTLSKKTAAAMLAILVTVGMVTPSYAQEIPSEQNSAQTQETIENQTQIQSETQTESQTGGESETQIESETQT